MASIAIRLMADVGGLTQGFARAEQRAEEFKNRLQQIGNVTGKAFAPAAAGLRAVAAGTGNVLSTLGRLSSVASSSAAILSKFSQGNEELKKRFESLTITLAILAPALSALGPAIAFLTGPIGLVIAAIGGAVLVFMKWDAISRAVTNAAARVWAKLAEFFVNLWGGLGQAAIGLGQILLGALTLDIAKIQEGYQQMIAGFTAVKDTMVTAAVGIASGVGSIVTRLGEMAASLVDTKKKTEGLSEATQRMLQNIQLQLDAEEAAAQRASEIREVMRQVDQEQAETARAATAERIAQIQAVITAEEDAARRAAEIREVERQIKNEQLAAEAARVAQAQEVAKQEGLLLLEMFAGHKAAAIAQAIISTHAGVARALELPFPLNFAVAAAVLARGLASIASIKAAKLAEGGIVTRPTLALMGEAGPEAVIPLRGERGFGAFQDRPIVIHNITTLDGRVIAKSVAEHLPGEVRIRSGIRTA